jgi:hypothetical protein
MDWFEPKNIREWSRRVFSLRPVFLFLCILFIGISELRFDWAEQLVGRYLVSTNTARPESGAIWEIGHKAISAQKTVEKIVTDRQASQREAFAASSLAEIQASLTPDGWITMSSEHFKNMFLRLPPELAKEIILPFDLLRLYNRGKLERLYFKKEGEDLIIYLLDDQNLVLKKLTASSDLIERIDKHDRVWHTRLEQIDSFKNRIYPADRFFEVLNDFPEDVRRSVISQPERFLRMPGVITHVGISDEAIAGFIELGLEIEDAGGIRVIVVHGYEWAVWRLRARLQESAPAASTAATLSNGN